MTKPTKTKWTAREKLRVVGEASRLSDRELGEFLRREGVHEAQLTEWRTAAEAALGDLSRTRAAKALEEKRVRTLEREIRRKDKALAEMAALVVLKKKVLEIWGDEDADTDERTAR